MLSLKSRFTRLSTGLVVATALALGASMPAFASDTITQGITGGSLTASVADVAIATPVTYSHSAQTVNGSMTLTADDSTGSGAGWNVTIQSSAFVWSAGTSGAANGTNIAASAFSITSVDAPVMTAGQAVSVTDGPMVPTTSPVGSLDSARKVIQANAAYGSGTYTQAIGVRLNIPAQSHAGTYTGTLTTTISAAP